MKKKINKILFFIVNNWVYFLFLIPIIYIILSLVYLDNDAWFLLNSGRYVLNNGIPYIEPFTIHKNLDFVMQQWLCASIFWIIWKNLGKYAFFIFLLVICSLILYLYYKLLFIVSNNKYKSIIFSCLAFILMKNFFVSRPQIFTYLFLIIELILLEKYTKYNKKNVLFFLPIISLLQVNFHSSMWLMLFCFILPYIIDGIKIKKLKDCDYSVKPLIIVTIIMFLVGFINPYGYKAMFYLFNSYGIKEINSFISEMQRLNFNYLYFKIIIILMSLFILFINSKNNKSIKIRYILLLFGGLLLSFMNVKGFPYFCLLFFISFSLIDFSFIKKIKIKQNKITSILKYIIIGFKIGFPVMLVISFFYLIYSSFYNLHYENLLKGTADYIINDSNCKEIKLYVGYNNGGYMEYRGIKSYIDPRAEIFLKSNNNKEDIFLEYYNIEFNASSKDFKKFIKKYDFDYILVYDGDNFDNYLKGIKLYKKVYSTKNEKNEILYNLYKKV